MSLLRVLLVIGTLNVLQPSINAKPIGESKCTAGATNSEEVFCFGGRDNVTSLGGGQGCFKSGDCQVFMEATVVGNSIKWSLYGLYQEAGWDTQVSFFITKEPVDLGYKQMKVGNTLTVISTSNQLWDIYFNAPTYSGTKILLDKQSGNVNSNEGASIKFSIRKYTTTTSHISYPETGAVTYDIDLYQEYVYAHIVQISTDLRAKPIHNVLQSEKIQIIGPKIPITPPPRTTGKPGIGGPSPTPPGNGDSPEPVTDKEPSLWWVWLLVVFGVVALLGVVAFFLMRKKTKSEPSAAAEQARRSAYSSTAGSMSGMQRSAMSSSMSTGNSMMSQRSGYSTNPSAMSSMSPEMRSKLSAIASRNSSQI